MKSFLSQDSALNNALPFNSYFTEGSLETSEANFLCLNSGRARGLLENSPAKTMLLKGRVRVCLWHSEQALKQENIETVLRLIIIIIKNKNMAMICALWKGSRFLLNIAI